MRINDLFNTWPVLSGWVDTFTPGGYLPWPNTASPIISILELYPDNTFLKIEVKEHGCSISTVLKADAKVKKYHKNMQKLIGKTLDEAMTIDLQGCFFKSEKKVCICEFDLVYNRGKQ